MPFYHKSKADILKQVFCLIHDVQNNAWIGISIAIAIPPETGSRRRREITLGLTLFNLPVAWPTILT